MAAKSQTGLQLTRAFYRRHSTLWDLVVLAAAAYKGNLSWCEEGPMMYDNQADAQHLYGGIDRLRANILVSQAAYAEASKRATRNRDIAAAKAARTQVVGEHALLSL